MLNSSKLLIAIVGPTAVGKTELCIKLAQQLNTEIISADSRQFFKELSIGTAKPSEEELKLANHHFINSHHVTEDFSAGKFETEALELLSTLWKNYDYIIVTGGSGLYVKALAEGFSQMPEIPNEIRVQLNQEMEDNGLEMLQQELKNVDRQYYEKVDLNNPQRIIRALEVYRASGKTFTSFHNQATSPRDFQTLYIGLERPRVELYDRINQRVDLMIAQGLLEEVKAVYPHKYKPALQTVGYNELFLFLDGQLAWEEAVALIKRNTRRYAKRQMTWFKKNEKITWFHPDDYHEILKHIKDKISET